MIKKKMGFNIEVTWLKLLKANHLSTTMNIYTHGSRESKRSAVMLLENEAI
nr:hypothetical protein [Fusobacterium varium]